MVKIVLFVYQHDKYLTLPIYLYIPLALETTGCQACEAKLFLKRRSAVSLSQVLTSRWVASNAKVAISVERVMLCKTYWAPWHRAYRGGFVRLTIIFYCDIISCHVSKIVQIPPNHTFNNYTFHKNCNFRFTLITQKEGPPAKLLWRNLIPLNGGHD